MADPVRLRQVVGNLVNNATKFTEAGGWRIRVDRDPADGRGCHLDRTPRSGASRPIEIRQPLFEALPSRICQSTTRWGHGGTGLTGADSTDWCGRWRRVEAGQYQWHVSFAFFGHPPVVGAIPRTAGRCADWRVRIGEIGTLSRAAIRYLTPSARPKRLSIAVFLLAAPAMWGPLGVCLRDRGRGCGPACRCSGAIKPCGDDLAGYRAGRPRDRFR
jgi:hypothetical protein